MAHNFKLTIFQKNFNLKQASIAFVGKVEEGDSHYTIYDQFTEHNNDLAKLLDNIVIWLAQHSMGQFSNMCIRPECTRKDFLHAIDAFFKEYPQYGTRFTIQFERSVERSEESPACLSRRNVQLAYEVVDIQQFVTPELPVTTSCSLL